VRSQLVDIMKTLKMPLVSCGSNWDVVRKSITAAYAHSPVQRPLRKRPSVLGRGTARPHYVGTVCLCRVALPTAAQRQCQTKPQLYSLQRSSTAQHCRHSVAHCAATGSGSLQVGNAMRLLTSGHSYRMTQPMQWRVAYPIGSSERILQNERISLIRSDPIRCNAIGKTRALLCSAVDPSVNQT
jgi:hypothetical protein